MPSSLTPNPRDAQDLAALRALGIDPDRLDFGHGGVDPLPKADERELITARHFLEYIATQRGIDLSAATIHPWVIATFQHATYAKLVNATGAQPSDFWKHMSFEVAHGMVREQPVTIARLHVGAPSAVSRIEELIACGGQRFIVLGIAGALRHDLPLGAAILATGALREDGTSFHYIPAGTEVIPDRELTEDMAAACVATQTPFRRGPVWTTDAPYRELASKVSTYSTLGILAVEMEAAALFAVAMLRGVRLSLLMAISDHLSDPWRPGFMTAELKTAYDMLVAVALSCVSSARERDPV